MIPVMVSLTAILVIALVGTFLYRVMKAAAKRKLAEAAAEDAERFGSGPEIK